MPGNDLVYQITFDNYSDVTAEDVVITDTLPPALTYVSWSGSADMPDAVDLDETISVRVARKRLAPSNISNGNSSGLTSSRLKKRSPAVFSKRGFRFFSGLIRLML